MVQQNAYPKQHIIQRPTPWLKVKMCPHHPTLYLQVDLSNTSIALIQVSSSLLTVGTYI